MFIRDRYGKIKDNGYTYKYKNPEKEGHTDDTHHVSQLTVETETDKTDKIKCQRGSSKKEAVFPGIPDMTGKIFYFGRSVINNILYVAGSTACIDKNKQNPGGHREHA
jgi:hypothetical protein